MDSDAQGIIAAYIAKAEEKLQAAKGLLVDEAFDDAASRAYYAAFHAVHAALHSFGMSPDTHAGTEQLFQLHFIKGKILDPKFGKSFSRLRERREEGDYEALSTIDRADAEETVQQAGELINVLRNWLKEKGYIK